MDTGTGPPRPGDERGTAGDGATGLVSDGGFGARQIVAASLALVLVVAALLGWIAYQMFERVEDLSESVTFLQSEVSLLESRQQAVFAMTTTTPAPPIDLPPPDGEEARAAVVASIRSLFDPERVASVFPEPSTADPLLALASSHPCVDELDAVVTEVRFVDDDTASVRFDVTGEPLRQMSFQVDRAYGFDTSVHRTPAGWKVDPSLAGRMADTGRLLRSVPGC